MNLIVNSPQDLNRQIIKSDFASLKIPEIEFEIPELTQKSILTTVEGVLERISENIQSDIQLRQQYDPELCDKLKDFLIKVNELRLLRKPFHLIIDDPSGESFIQNPNAPSKDDHLTVSFYKRNSKQNELLGLTVCNLT